MPGVRLIIQQCSEASILVVRLVLLSCP